MGVYIANVEKPKSCAECQFEVIDTSGYTRCVIMQEMVVDGNLFNRCPIEEIEEWNSYSNGKIYAPKGTFQKIYDGERGNDE